MDLFVSFSPDGLEAKAQKLALSNDEAGFSRLSQAVERSNEFWKSWILECLGSVISLSWNGMLRVPADHLEDLDSVRSRAASCLEHSITCGVGVSMADAERALIAALLRGGDRILLFTPELEDELEQFEEKERQQNNGAAPEQPLGKTESPFVGAAFRHKATGQIIHSGHTHDLLNIPEDDPDMEQWEDGFVDHLGNFHTGHEAHEVLKEHGLTKFEAYTVLHKADVDGPQDAPDQTPVTEAPMNKPNAGGGFASRQQAGDEAPPQAPSPEASQSYSQGMATQAWADDQSAPEGTHAESDFEDELHSHAQEQDDRDQDAQEAQDGRGEARKQVVEILQQVRQLAPQLEQLKEQAPELYQAMVGMVKALMLTGRSLLSDEKDHDENAEKHVGGEESSGDSGEDSNPGEESPAEESSVKKSETDAMPQQFDADVLNAATDHEMEHTKDREEAQKIAMDHLREDPFYYQKLQGVAKTDLSPVPNYPPVGSAGNPFGASEDSPEEPTVTLDPRRPVSKPKPKPPVVKDEWTPELEKARVTGRQHIELPVGAEKAGKKKVKDTDEKTHWVSVRSGMVLGNEGHVVSSRNPSAK